MEINSKQGAPASQVMNILQTACRGGWGGAADRAGLMRMTLKVAENRKILSFFICMQIRLLHKLTSEPRCQSSSWVEAGPPPGPRSHCTHPHFPSQVSGGFILSSRGIVELQLRPLLFTALIGRRDDLTVRESETALCILVMFKSHSEVSMKGQLFGDL